MTDAWYIDKQMMQYKAALIRMIVDDAAAERARTAFINALENQRNDPNGVDYDVCIDMAMRSLRGQ